jgi:hypothetical protein
MKFSIILSVVLFALSVSLHAQNPKAPCTVKLKDGKTIEAIHFGQLKCGKEVYGQNYIIVRGKFMDNPTEIKEYKDIEKIVLEGFDADPAVSVGNQKSTLIIYKKNGVSVTLEEAELAMSCYAPGDKYNTIVVQIMNPLTNQAGEQVIETKEIQSIIFK